MPNSIQIRQSMSNSLSNLSIRDYFCSNPHTSKFGESQKQTEVIATSHIFRSETGLQKNYWLLSMNRKRGVILQEVEYITSAPCG